MPRQLKRYQDQGNHHFVTFSCYRRQPYLDDDRARIAFEEQLETLRVRFPEPCLAETSPFTLAQASCLPPMTMKLSWTGHPNRLVEDRETYNTWVSHPAVDQAGNNGFKALNNQKEIPWVWSVIEFKQNGAPDYGRIWNASPNAYTTNYQLFPTYSVYVNGKLTYKTIQGTPAAFSSLPSGLQLSPSTIQ